MKKKIMIIDEELWFIDSLKDLLIHNLEVEIIEYSNPKYALEYISKNKIDLIILDILMPLQNLELEADYEYEFKNAGGLYVLKKIRNTNFTGNVICYTILTDAFIITNIEKNSNTFYLDKAADVETILNTITKYL